MLDVVVITVPPKLKQLGPKGGKQGGVREEGKEGGKEQED